MQRRVDDAGSYGVKSNVLFCVFKSQASYDRVQTTFGDHWNGSWHSGDRVIRQRCADANNASTVFSACLCIAAECPVELAPAAVRPHQQRTLFARAIIDRTTRA